MSTGTKLTEQEQARKELVLATVEEFRLKLEDIMKRMPTCQSVEDVEALNAEANRASAEALAKMESDAT